MSMLPKLPLTNLSFKITDWYPHWVQNIVIHLEMLVEIETDKVIPTKEIIWSSYGLKFITRKFLLHRTLNFRINWHVIRNQKRWPHRQIIFPPPLLQPLQLIHLKHPRTFIPLRVHKDRIHLLHLHRIKYTQIRFLHTRSQPLHYLLRMQKHSLNRHVVKIRRTIGISGVRWKHSDMIIFIDEGLHQTDYFVESCILFSSRPFVDKVVYVHRLHQLLIMANEYYSPYIINRIEEWSFRRNSILNSSGKIRYLIMRTKCSSGKTKSSRRSLKNRNASIWS